MAKDFSAMTPREIEAFVREKIRVYFGDEIENLSTVHASHGYYSVNVVRPKDYTIGLQNFRKSDVPRIVSQLRFLAKGKAVTEYYDGGGRRRPRSLAKGKK